MAGLAESVLRVLKCEVFVELFDKDCDAGLGARVTLIRVFGSEMDAIPRGIFAGTGVNKSPVKIRRFLTLEMRPQNFSAPKEGISAPPQKQKGNGEVLRLRIALPLDGGGARKSTATMTMLALTETEQEQADANIQSLLSSLARWAVSEEGGRHDVQQ